MKLWRKLGNKVTIIMDNMPIKLTGRQFKQYQQVLHSNQKPASKLMLALMRRI